MLVAMLFALTPVAVVAIAAVIAVAAVAAAVDHCTNGTRVVQIPVLRSNDPGAGGSKSNWNSTSCRI